MKIDTEENVLERSGVLNRISCTISVNKHSFNLLARQYKDPIKAILQELGSNAVDSHVRAGNDQPFSISLPGILNNQFRIRDYGTGMSKDIIENVYTQWMNSDKRNSNTEIGCFGIGSKTPLAYTSSFNITSYVDGTVSMYSLCFNEVGIPELQHYGDFPTDEPNGVEISFSVKDEDFSRFSNAANSVYNYFSIKPLIDGVLPTKQLEVVSTGDRWKIYNLEETHSSRIVFVMGGVAYPMESYYFKRYFNNIRNRQIAIEVEIGSLDITPSRESLEITPKTSNTVNAELKRVYEEISENLVIEVDSIDSTISDWAYYNEVKNIFRKYSDLGYDETYMRNKKYSRKVRIYPAKVSQDVAKYMCSFNERRGKVTREDHESDARLSFNPDNSEVEYLVLDDVLDSKTLKKIKYHVRMNGCLLKVFSYVKGCGLQNILDEIGAYDGEIKFLTLSDLLEVPREPRKSGTYTRLPKEIVSVRTFIGGNIRLAKECWSEPTKKDISTGEYYYCKVNRSNPECIHIENLKKISNFLGIKIISFGVVPKKIKNFPNVKNLDDPNVLKELLKVWVDNNKNSIEEYRVYNFFKEKFDIGSRYSSSGAWYIIDHLNNIGEKLGTEHILTKFKKYISIGCKNYDWVYYLANKKVFESEFDFTDLFNEFGSNLLKYNGISGDSDDIVRLVNMVDSFDKK